jgi:hypothetical protein
VPANWHVIPDAIGVIPAAIGVPAANYETKVICKKLHRIAGPSYFFA